MSTHLMNSPVLPVVPVTPNPQPPTVPAVAPEPAPPPMPVVNRQAHVKPDARPVAAAAELLRNADAKFQQHLASINVVGLDANRLHSEIAAFSNSPAMKQVDEAERLVIERDEAAEQAVTDIVKGLSPQGDTAQELRAGRAWDRAVRQLDSVSPDRVPEMARKLIANASSDELGVLLTELPSLLTSKGHENLDWIEQAVAQKVPELAKALEQRKLATQARTLIAYDAGRVRERVTKTARPGEYAPIRWTEVGKYDPDAAGA